jgi:uncharacterized membrane protein YphA (DoxX/SURF4 family)
MLLETIDRLHQRRDARVFTWMTRLLLAVAFLPSGLVKLQGERFTRLGIDNPVGFFFEAFYRTGIYWNFLGAAQLLAAALILIPRTRVLGAIVYFPIILNIFLITYAMHFRGTVYITGLMLLGSLWLLLWDARTLRCLFVAPGRQLSAVSSQLSGTALHGELDHSNQT